MEYTFITQAQQEPDLEDFLNYLKQPLVVIKDLFSKYEQTAKSTNTAITQLEGYAELYKIMYSIFPNLIEHYCSFSFTYRNTVKIKEDSKNKDKEWLTAKELLLINTAKLIEEIYILEKNFNESNKFNFLVDNRLIKNFGIQPDILNIETEPEIVLPNQFNYQNYMSKHMENIFTKPQVVIPTLTNNTVEKLKTVEDLKIAIKDTKTEEISKKHTNEEALADTTFGSYDSNESTEMAIKDDSSNEVAFMGMFLGAIILGVVFWVGASSSHSPKPVSQIIATAQVQEAPLPAPEPLDKEAFNNLSDLTQIIDKFLTEHPKEPLSLNYLATAGYIPKDSHANTNSYNGDLELVDARLFAPHDAYTITMNHVPAKNCQWMAAALSEHVNQIIVNNNITKGGTFNYNYPSLASFCTKPENTIQITNTKVYTEDPYVQKINGTRTKR
jgi:hypothetical protein